jgi:hypothetical protein
MRQHTKRPLLVVGMVIRLAGSGVVQEGLTARDGSLLFAFLPDRNRLRGGMLLCTKTSLAARARHELACRLGGRIYTRLTIFVYCV